MKKLKKVFVLLLMALLVVPVMVFAQGDVIVPDSEFSTYFASLAAMVSLVTLIISWLKTYLKMSGTAVQIVSWILSIALSYVGFFFNIGLFASIQEWWVIGILGFAIGLAANGFANIALIKAILKAIGLLKTKPGY